LNGANTPRHVEEFKTFGQFVRNRLDRRYHTSGPSVIKQRKKRQKKEQSQAVERRRKEISKNKKGGERMEIHSISYTTLNLGVHSL